MDRAERMTGEEARRVLRLATQDEEERHTRAGDPSVADLAALLNLPEAAVQGYLTQVREADREIQTRLAQEEREAQEVLAHQREIERLRAETALRQADAEATRLRREERPMVWNENDSEWRTEVALRLVAVAVVVLLVAWWWAHLTARS